MADNNMTPLLVVSGSAVLAGLVLLHRLGKKLPGGSTMRSSPPLGDGDVTVRFTAAIPEITPLVNLELAVAKQVETFSHASAKKWWGGLDLGTSTVQLRVPVSYRYHVNLRERWRVDIRGKRVVVQAPVIRPSLPPAIHTDGLEKLSVRGWARGGTGEQMRALERSVTPVLNELAADARHLELVRGQCRQSVAEFVRLWLEREGVWHRQGVSEIEVRFAQEVGSENPTLKLGDGAKGEES